jgi:hypothetical protein
MSESATRAYPAAPTIQGRRDLAYPAGAMLPLLRLHGRLFSKSRLGEGRSHGSAGSLPW